MNTQSRKALVILSIIGALVIAVSSALLGYRLANRSDQSERTTQVTRASSTERKVLYWYDPMVPAQRFDKPGKSPFMDMELVPKYADETEPESGVRIDPQLVQNLGTRFTTIERGTASQTFTVIGSIVFNERTVAVVQARANGFVARGYARAPGDVIPRGAPLADLLVPEWAGAQAEFLALLDSGERDLIDAARQRLVLLGMPEELIAAIEADRKPRTNVTVRTPIEGAISSLEVREGMTVSAGATLARINGLATVWLEAAIPETRGGGVGVGKSVDAQLTAFPGETFKGKVIAILPEANTETRTLRVRIELPNPDARLRPGMFARADLSHGGDATVLLVASEAVIHTGARDVVIVVNEDGRFTPTEVQTGGESGDRTIILQGLREGQKVVASGQFLIDSEASLNGALARLEADGSPPSTHGAHDNERRTSEAPLSSEPRP